MTVYVCSHLVKSCLADGVVHNTQALLVTLNLSKSG